ncbi:hypothetical protein [Faecalitalea cylindroides]|uniref:hypothetical protein n=1 Tax=Faecalitalea cylindroides TaxID=39483 RepID=UPI00232CADF9|nr:hypothetical protein [Faecalitalea cylindroides]MDB7951540.1 hypothetical protein [Faecalitalea cylindroides]MDB7958385.1 hypothetical protein [Faecalitalea cylindroides]MDB7960435.1 hypothetical protein [Faecalitalea cylindroides]MDB7962305.1 hypothetical protein [Faecalitalea cylindroides]MDB7964176.1 hypothetical protein [Faecalitalea cylindroides]
MINIEWLSIIIPSTVSIIGFIISYWQNRKYMENEVLKNKRSLMLEKGIELINEAKVFVDLNEMGKLNQKKLNDLVNDLYLYGSKDVITILSEFMQFNYLLQDRSNQDNIYKLMAYCTLIVVQLKYDYFGEITNPMDTLKIRLNDLYIKEGLYDQMKVKINSIIEELNLRKEFKIK